MHANCVLALAALSLPFAEAFSANHNRRLSSRSSTADATAVAPITQLSVAADLTKLDEISLDFGDETENIVTAKGSQNAWEVHKFGGASLANAELYKTVGDLLIAEASGTRKADNEGKGAVPTMAIVSARGGMTDLLVGVVDSALVDLEAAESVLSEAVEGQVAILRELADASITDPIEANIRNDANDILLLVQSLKMINTVPSVTMEVVTGYGEIWSAQTLNAYLKTKEGVPCEWIDARPILRVKSDSSGLGEKGEASTGGVVPLWEETTACLSNWWNTVGKDRGMHDCDYQSGVSPIIVVTGFVASTIDGVPTTLKRSGSDYSATIFAKLTGSSRVTMWKNTDGVYTADPRRVPEAFSIASLKYDEALELAYFGAQVLHPSAMVPCIDDNIPVYVRNIFNPSFQGTVVQGRSPSLREISEQGQVKNWRADGEIPIKGITSVDSVALVTLEGASTIGGSNVAEKFMRAMATNDINVLIITQASSESSICIAVPENEGDKAITALQSAFELELARSTVGSISLNKGLSIVAIVGEGMAYSSGISSTLMGSLSKANVNIRLIAQGSSERQIAVVVGKDDTTRALRAAHQAFTLSDTTASITLLGATGEIGTAFVGAIQKQRRTLINKLGVCPRIMLSASSKKMAIAKNANGLPIDTIITDLTGENDVEDLDLDRITAELEADVNPHRVVIDMTNSDAVSEYYERWMSAGVDLISPSRKVAAGPLDVYNKVVDAQKGSSVNWQYESSVGSALPILTTLRDLIETGDEVHKILGSVSGTFAYVLSLLSEETSFSDAFGDAIEKSFPEKDIREDLTGEDVARKVVILARQIGMDVEMEDVEVESFLPEELASKSEITLEDLKSLDEGMLKKFKAAKAEDKVLRYKFEINKDTGKCRCFLAAVDNTDPLYRLKSIENLVAFETDRYTASPLIVKGAAAGPELAAAGIFSDLLRCTRAYSSERN